MPDSTVSSGPPSPLATATPSPVSSRAATDHLQAEEPRGETVDLALDEAASFDVRQGVLAGFDPAPLAAAVPGAGAAASTRQSGARQLELQARLSNQTLQAIRTEFGLLTEQLLRGNAGVLSAVDQAVARMLEVSMGQEALQKTAELAFRRRAMVQDGEAGRVDATAPAALTNGMPGMSAGLASLSAGRPAAARAFGSSSTVDLNALQRRLRRTALAVWLACLLAALGAIGVVILLDRIGHMQHQTTDLEARLVAGQHETTTQLAQIEQLLRTQAASAAAASGRSGNTGAHPESNRAAPAPAPAVPRNGTGAPPTPRHAVKRPNRQPVRL